jgi:hypothetical protein
LASDISKAAAFDDVYKLVELTYACRREPAKLEEIAAALEESIPRLDPVRFKGELEHVVDGPDIPELARAKEMAQAALDGRPVPGAATGEGTAQHPGQEPAVSSSLVSAGWLLLGRPRRKPR